MAVHVSQTLCRVCAYLVVKVTHDNNKALVLFTQKMVYRYLGIVELDECGTCRCGVARLDELGLYGLIAFDE